MRRLALLSLVALLPASAALADGCPPITCGTTSVAPPGSRVLVMRPNGQLGPALGYDLVSREWRYSLPSGILSADGLTFVSGRARQGRATTTVVRYDARTGRVRSRWSIGGRLLSVAAVSPHGRHVALVRNLRERTFVVVAGRAGRSVVALHGNFQVEALSPDGRRVFLVHWRRNGYELQNLDLETRALQSTRLAEPEEKMEGTPLSAVGTRDGRWLHTLYVKANGESFVHALDLAEGIGHCIDLPLRGDLFTLGTSALTLSPDERRLLVTGPLVGRVTTVDLRDLSVARVARFRPLRLARYVAGSGIGAAVNANGRVLAFNAGPRLWLYDTAYGAVRGPFTSPYGIAGLGFRSAGRHVLAVGPGGYSRVYDAATGRQVR